MVLSQIYHLLILIGIQVHKVVVDGVYILVTHPNLIMDMGSGTLTCGTGLGNLLAAYHLLALLNKKVVMEPLKGRFGGVADFKVTIATEGRVVNASRLVSGDAERLRQMVDKWETLTGEQPAYKQEILADICSKMDVASPENAPRVPKNIVFHPGGEIDVTYTTKKGNTPTLRIGADGKVKVNNVLLDINTGKFTFLQGQTQRKKQSPGESQAPTGEKKSGGHKR